MSPWWLRPTAEGASNDDESPEIEKAETYPQSSQPPIPAFGAEERAAEAATPSLPRAHYSYDPSEELPLPDDSTRFLSHGASRPEPFEPGPDEPEEGPESFEPETDGESDTSAAAAEPEETASEKRRRSRRGRGGRRRGRGAETNGSRAEEEESDEDVAEEEPRLAALPMPAPEPREREPRELREPRETREAREPRDRESREPREPREFREPREPRELRRRETSRAGESFSFTDEPLAREIVVTIPERPRSADERKIALFCDLENVALGVRDSDVSKFDINLVLERLLEKGKIIVKKAYADWERYSEYKRPFHEAAIEMIDIPQKYYSGKNSADIKMVVDAMDLSYSKEHLDTFVLLSGDSDFSPLVSKLKENNKYVIGIGVKNSSSNLLVDNCDEFIYYEDVWRDTAHGPQLTGLTKKHSEVFGLLVESIQALVRENKDVLWGSMIKQTMQRKKPSFNEGYYGYSTFSELLEDAERKNIVKLKKDQRSGTYIVTGFAKR